MIMPSLEHSVLGQQQLAAIDLGSNSFHLVVARLVDGHIQTLEKRGEKVQLAAGLDKQRRISEAAQGRALACLERFAQRIRGLEAHQITILGTNTLRSASNAKAFIEQANGILGFPIEVISGIEEARLVYLGVAHTLADDIGRRLVIDIGGGSTEFVIGERFEPVELESLHMGCVTYTDRFFPQGKITQASFERAIAAAKQEILRIKGPYQKLGWQNVVGSSGTIRAANRVLTGYGLSQNNITWDGLKRLQQMMVDWGDVTQLNLQGVKDERQKVFAAGVAILIGVFETLDLQEMTYSDGALREGALYDLIGRAKHEDVRERTVRAMQARFKVDKEQAVRVRNTALALFEQVKQSWSIDGAEYKNGLRWSAELFEVGLGIAHSQFHKHGAYLVGHADMPGFSLPTQAALAVMIRHHRRKLHIDSYDIFSEQEKVKWIRLTMLLRLAVLLHQGRGIEAVAIPTFSIDQQRIHLSFPANWLHQHPMTSMDLELETSFLHAAGYELVFH